jgi:ATP-binding cassette subfamily F protein 3
MATILSTEALSKAHGPLMLFENATLSFDETDKIGFIGRNGAGKSTLLNIITGQEEADSGSVSRHPNLRMGYLKQLDDFNEGESVIGFMQRMSGKPDWFCGKIGAQFELKKEKLETNNRFPLGRLADAREARGAVVPGTEFFIAR